MNYQNPHFQILGERAVLISWEAKIDENLLGFILNAKKNVLKDIGKVIVEVIHTYNSLLVKYKYDIKNIYGEISLLKSIVSKALSAQKTEVRHFRIPVCYHQKFGLDLAEISAKNKLDIPEIISVHSSPIYTIFFMGFLPGFLYLGGLEKKLFIGRKNQARKRIIKGAVGIGGKQTGIYPKNSPGGWQIIGNCPLNFFDPNKNPPSIFRAGDQIRFYPISPKRHQVILEQVEEGTFQIKTETP